MTDHGRIVEGRSKDNVRYRITAIQFPEHVGSIAILLQHKNYRVAALFGQEQLKLLVEQLTSFIE